MGMGVAADDWDRDGDWDVYFTNAGPAVLLENQGDGTFRNQADEAGVALDSKSVAWGAVSLDFDNDSNRDLYVATMKRALAGASNPLFQNDGTGKFAEIGYTSGAGDPGPSLGAVSYTHLDVYKRQLYRSQLALSHATAQPAAQHLHQKADNLNDADVDSQETQSQDVYKRQL